MQFWMVEVPTTNINRHNRGLILYGLRFDTKKIFRFKYKISLVENQSYGYKMDGKSVRLSAMNQAPSTQEETKNCSTSNCGLPNIPYFQKSRNLYVQKAKLRTIRDISHPTSSTAQWKRYYVSILKSLTCTEDFNQWWTIKVI